MNFISFFVSGRSCELKDWAIDTVGAFVGAAAFFIIRTIAGKAAKSKNNIDT